MRTPHRCSSRGASRSGSTSARQPNRRSRCSSATRASTGPPRASWTALEEERVVPDRDRTSRSGARTGALSAHAGLDDLTPPERSVSTSCTSSSMDLLDQPEVTGLEARNLVERRRAEALRIVGDARRRANGSSTRHARISSRRRRRISRGKPRSSSRCRRAATRGSRCSRSIRLEWRVEVAARDRPGLLAVVSGVLADHGLDILDAVVATWPDGGALDSFRYGVPQLEPARLTPEELERIAPPDPATLEAGIAGAFNGRSRCSRTLMPMCVSTTTLHRGTRCARSAARTVVGCCTVSRPGSRARAPTCTPHIW